MSDVFNHEAEAWDRLLDGEEQEPRYSKPITCTRCGKHQLKWKHLKEGWRLHYWTPEGLKLHKCNDS